MKYEGIKNVKKKIIIIILTLLGLLIFGGKVNATVEVENAEELQNALGGEEYVILSDNTLKLNENIILTEQIKLNSGILKIDLNGKTITSNEPIILNIDGANLTIIDSSNGNGKIISNRLIFDLNSGYLEINSGEFIAKEIEGATASIIEANNNSNLVINGGKFISYDSRINTYNEQRKFKNK